MPAPNIILQKGQILLSQTNSIISIDIDNSPFLFGLVELVNDLSDTYKVSDVVIFDPVDATILKSGGISYYLTTEDKILFQEVALS